MPMFRILNRWNDSLIFEADTESLKLCVELAVRQRVSLRAANLRAADLSSANLSVIRDDFWAVLSAEPMGVPYLRQALIDGKVDGSTYASDCKQGCLVGTLAYGVNKGCDHLDVLKPNSSRPAEMFFLSIRPGSTPENNQHAKLALDWLDAWPPLALMQLPAVSV